MNSKTIFSDIKSGIVVFLVALPLCLGIALACGVPLFSGIIAGTIGGIVVTSLSTAKYSVSGPAAGLTAIIISALAELGNFEYLLAATILAGAIQIVLGYAKAGGIGNYIPNAVIKGMLAGIGIILIIKQLPHFVGYDANPEGEMDFNQPDGHNSITDLYFMMNYITPGSIIVGIVSFAIIFITDLKSYKKNRVFSFIPGPLLVVISGILLSMAFSSNAFLQIGSEHLVNLPEISSILDLKNNLIFPNFSKWSDQSFLTIAVTLAVVASLETLLSIEAIEKLDPDKIPVSSNKELVAQGVGNMVSGLIGGLPITSVIVRSSANLNSGARTKFSVILHAILLISCVLLIPHILRLIPNSSLAVILIMTGYKLARLPLFKNQFRMGWDQFLPFVVTISVMLLTDLLKGVAAGVVVSLVYIIRFNIKASFEVSEQIVNGKRSHLIKLPQHITFFNKGFITNYLNNIQHGSRVTIDGSINKSTDKDVKEILVDFIESARLNNIEIHLVKYSIL